MSKRKKPKYVAERFESAKLGEEHYFTLYDSVIDSPLFKSLSNSARTVYLVIRRQYKGNYSGKTVECPYRVFAEYGLQNKTVSRAIAELEESGFIEVERGTIQCAKNKNLRRQPNRYTLSSRWWER